MLSGGGPPFNVAVLFDTALNISSFGEDEAGELYVVGLGGTVHQLVGQSETARANFITGLYTNLLGRSPGAAELGGWADFLRANCTAAGIQAVADGFFSSTEFRARSFTLPSLVTVVYRALLGREPDAPGLGGWTDVLRQARLVVAVNGFIPSAEFGALLPNRTDRAAVTDVITRFYAQVLGRSPDPAGRAGWVDFVVASGDLETAAVGFLASAEFETRALTFRGYVTIIYRTFLGREPDPVGLAGWEAVVQAALTTVVESGFLQAAEFEPGSLCGV
jgi:hypothetical protein